MPIKPKNYFIDRKCHRCGSVETTQGYGGPYHNMKIEDCPVLRDDRIPR